MNVDYLLQQIDNSSMNYALECVDDNTLNNIELKNNLLATLQNYRVSADLEGLTTNERAKLLTTLVTLENSIDDIVDFSVGLQNVQVKSGNIFIVPFLNKGTWLKSFVQTVVKIVLVTICIVVGMVGGLILADLVS